ncbi:hypothetical protein CBR_g37104 [Chara braunii]|uniref:Reverse transcriptase domain-containing protein n=1 Tax=Chara braunii TaxID=69332 RepID=A0A388LM38_CHABU|nr:hypothetical protein CBR_g37104 [Chara braunii]|eukprot:GBG83390.1 hypothetical protein CBR_g37104 [Chara braunii]
MEEAAELIPLDQYVTLGYPGLGMIGNIRPAPEQREVAKWRPSPGEMESGGPTFVTGEIDVLNIVRALDHRIPFPIGHLHLISEQANERMLQHCKRNRKQFALARTANTKTKSPAQGENVADTSDPIQLGLIHKDDNFLRIKPIPWKSAECDIEIWGIPYNAIIDSGAAVLAISLRVVERAERKSVLIMLTEKYQLVSADEEKIKTVGRMTNVAIRLGKVHALEDVVVLDVNTYDVFFGLPALVALRANLDFKRRSIVLRNTGGKPYVVPMRLTLRTTANVTLRVSLMMAGTLRMITWNTSADGEQSPKDAYSTDEEDPLILEMRAMNVTFQNFVNKTRLTQGMINFCVIMYMNDILVYSETFHGHAQYIEWTLGALRDAGFKIALEKSEFFSRRNLVLGLHGDTWRITTGFKESRGGERGSCPHLTWTRDTESRTWIEYAELLIIQAWKTEVERDLLGFLFRSVRAGHRQQIVQELTIPFAQVVDDLPLDIISQCDKGPVPHVFSRTLTPYLQWWACLEELAGNNNPPSQQLYLDPRGIIDLTSFQPRTASEDEAITLEEEEDGEGGDEEEEEETSEEGSYSEYSEEEPGEEEEEEEEEEDQLEEEESEWETLGEEAERAEEDPEAVRKREEITAGKQQLEYASEADLLSADDPAKDLEPPKPEDGDQQGDGEADPPPPPPQPVPQFAHVPMRGIGLRPRFDVRVTCMSVEWLKIRDLPNDGMCL